MRRLFLFVFFFFLCLPLFFCAPVWGGKPYKIYVINQYGAWDIVCDPYTVQKDDRIWEILRRKGRIAEEDFPRFIKILKEMNPDIQDVNMIYPDQQILVPLKQIPAREDRQAQDGPRYVTIPMIPDILYKPHPVKSGDTLSEIVTAQLGMPWHDIPPTYFESLKELNPQIKDLNLIYAGDKLRIPDLTLVDRAVAAAAEKATDEGSDPGPGARDEAKPLIASAKKETVSTREGATSNQPLSESTQLKKEARHELSPEKISTSVPRGNAQKPRFDSASGKISQGEGTTTSRNIDIVFPSRSPASPQWQGLVSQVLSQVGGRLLASGHCYFPGKGKGDVALDLAAFPVVELQNGQHLLMESATVLPQEIRNTVKASWKNLLVIQADPHESAAVVLEKLLRALFGDDIYREKKLAPFDDGVQVTLRGHWVFSQRNEKGELTHHAITLVQSQDERTPVAVLDYLKKRNVFVVDIFETLGERSLVRWIPGEDVTTKGKKLSIDGSGPEAFVADFTRSIGLFYEPKVPISFDYAGFQVETTGNIVYGGDGLDVIVDYGTFYGDASSAIASGGLTVLSIKEGESFIDIARNLLRDLKVFYTENPTLFVTNRLSSTTTSLTFPGFLINISRDEKALLTTKDLALQLIGFLHQQDVQIMTIKEDLSERKI